MQSTLRALKAVLRPVGVPACTSTKHVCGSAAQRLHRSTYMLHTTQNRHGRVNCRSQATAPAASDLVPGIEVLISFDTVAPPR